MRALSWRRAFLWTALGALATHLDQLHAIAGITVYPDAAWIGHALPFSPVYAGAGLAAYLIYVPLAAPPSGGWLGGARLGAWPAVASVAAFVAAYATTSALSGMHAAHTLLPHLCGIVLCLWALPVVWANRRATRVLAFLAIAASAGPAFEWLAVRRGAFAYGVCPTACLGADVPVTWLPALYLHAGILVHRLLSGRDPPRGACAAGRRRGD